MTTAIERSVDHRRERGERLLGIGADTPMGRFLRCYWYPIGAVVELNAWPVKKVRLLGEDLVLFRGDDGSLGLVAEHCPHRGASLACGMPDGANLRCAYHGWVFDATGQCLETPAEADASRLRERIQIAGYPVQEMGGLYWAYLGKAPAPLLPRWEQLVDENLERFVGVTDLPTSWLFCADNSCDPHHLEHLHMRYMNLVRRRQGLEPVEARKHAKIDFELFDYGILKKRLWEGESEDHEEWRIGHPLIFPATLFVPYGPTWVRFQFRVPVDEGRTMIYWYDARVPGPDYVNTGTVPVNENPFRDKAGKFILDRVNPQDMIMWVTQGPIPNHLAENLGESDRGIALFRRTLHEQMDRVERGEDPIGVIRDPAKNTPFVRLPIERHIGYSLGGASPSVNVEYPQDGVGRR